MKKVKAYLFYHFFALVRTFRKLNAEEAALLYVTTIDFFILLSLPVYIILFLFGCNSVIPFMVIALVYGFGLRWLNKKLFFRKRQIEKILIRYAGETKTKKIIGYALSVMLLVSSPIIGFSILFLLIKL